MKSEPSLIPQTQLTQIHGASMGLFFILEIPHIFMGIREFTNYIGDRWYNSNQPIDEKDYFTQFFSGWF